MGRMSSTAMVSSRFSENPQVESDAWMETTRFSADEEIRWSHGTCARTNRNAYSQFSHWIWFLLAVSCWYMCAVHTGAPAMSCGVYLVSFNMRHGTHELTCACSECMVASTKQTKQNIHTRFISVSIRFMCHTHTPNQPASQPSQPTMHAVKRKR